ncbi:uncharacterized protein LOC111518474 [Drosophila willistoni]|uniref:uncharacterized protein LOC111518474 n=1 Tax=Drosophila willistoni TaxID=7260 RepID=UPI00017D70AC|nr:uncharacterized protein LOC111518474 [Drosophila willistoni]
MEASKDKYKLKFSGCCKLTDDQLSEVYNLDLLSDEELASVNLERKSLVDDYRHLHELSMAHEQEQERIKQLELEQQLRDEELKLQPPSVLHGITLPGMPQQTTITPESTRILELLGFNLAAIPVAENMPKRRILYTFEEFANAESDEFDSDFDYFEDHIAYDAERMANDIQTYF